MPCAGHKRALSSRRRKDALLAYGFLAPQLIGLARKDVNLDEKNALAAELDNFIDAVIATRKAGRVIQPKVSGEAGLKALKLAVAIETEARRYNDQYGFKFAPCSPDELA